MTSRLLAGADGTGAIVLFEQVGNERPVPVSVQCGTWETWVSAAGALGAEPGALLVVELLKPDAPPREEMLPRA